MNVIKIAIVRSDILPDFYSFRLYDVNGKVTYRTIVLNIKHTSLSVINEILNSGTFRHNQIISGRVLK